MNRFLKSKTIFITFCLFFVSEANAQLTLKDALNMGIKSNKGIRSKELKVKAKDLAVSTAYGKYLPTISADFYYTHMNNDLYLDMDPIRSAMIQLEAKDQVSLANLQNVITKGAPLTPAEQLATYNYANSQLEAQIPHFVETVKEQTFPQGMISVQQPIFTGGKIIANVNASKAQQKAANYQLEDEKISFSREIVTSYINVLLAEKNLEVRQSVVDDLNRHVNQANKLMSEGVIAKHEKLRADVALSEAERNLFEAKEKVKIALDVLVSNIGSDNKSLTLGDSLKFKPFSNKLETLIAQAKTDNRKILALQAGCDALDAKTEAQFGDYLPTVFGYGFYNIFDHYIFKSMEPKWGIGIGAHWKIFDGLQQTHEYQEDKAETEAMRLYADEIERKIELLVRNQYQEVKISEEKYRQLESSLDQAEESLRLNARRFETGLGTSLEIIDAELALESVKLQKIKTLTEYYTYMAQLYETLGTTNEFLSFWASNN